MGKFPNWELDPINYSNINAPKERISTLCEFKGNSLWDAALNHAFDDAARNRKFGRSRKIKWRRFSFAFDKLDFLEQFAEKPYTDFNEEVHDWKKVQEQMSQDKDFFRECWNIALGDENKFGLFLVHAKNHCEVRLKQFTRSDDEFHTFLKT